MEQEFNFESIKNKALEQLKSGKSLLGKDGAFAPLLESILNAAPANTSTPNAIEMIFVFLVISLVIDVYLFGQSGEERLELTSSTIFSLIISALSFVTK